MLRSVGREFEPSVHENVSYSVSVDSSQRTGRCVVALPSMPA